jgi:hypothetical protein
MFLRFDAEIIFFKLHLAINKIVEEVGHALDDSVKRNLIFLF